MSRSFCIPGVVILLCAFVLLFLTSISLPHLTAMDITRTHFNGQGSPSSSDAAITQIRFGIWAYCYESDGKMMCNKTGHGYTVGLRGTDGSSITIGSRWTRGLAVHPIAAGVTFVALLFSFSTHMTMTLFASMLSFLAAAITLIAFAIDIVLFAYVKTQMKKLSDVDENTLTGPGFWLTFVSFILLLIAGCTVCIGRRKNSTHDSSYPMTSFKSGFFARFNKNNS